MITPRVSFFVLVRMLLDHDAWELVKPWGFEVMLHRDGYEYYSDLGCVVLSNESFGLKQEIGLFEFFVIAPLAARNSRRVRNRPTEKDRFDKICKSGMR